MPAHSDSATDEVAHLRKLVDDCNGNRSAIARALSDPKAGTSITRQGVTARLRRHGLLETADNLRSLARQPGPRVHVSGDEVKAERARILDALASVPNYDAAVPLLDMSVATMYRKIALHKITPVHVSTRRRQLERAAARAAKKKPRRTR